MDTDFRITFKADLKSKREIVLIFLTETDMSLGPNSLNGPKDASLANAVISEEEYPSVSFTIHSNSLLPRLCECDKSKCDSNFSLV